MKKVLMILTAACLLSVAVIGCGGSDVDILPQGAAGTEGDVEPHPMPTPDVVDGAPDVNPDDLNTPNPYEGTQYGADGMPAFISVTGTVVNIEIVDGFRHVEIEDADGNTAFLILNEETVFPFSENIVPGDTITGWYCAQSMIPMIYPPQYPILVLSSRMGDDNNIKADRFHIWHEVDMGQFISSDEMFVFMTDENTEIVLQDGQDFSDGDLNNRRIVVIYGPSTRSLPEIATAEKLIVLFEAITPGGA